MQSLHELPKPKASSRKNLAVFLAFAFAFGAFLSGMQFGKGAEAYQQTASLFSFFGVEEVEGDVISQKPDLEEFWNVWELLEEKYATGSTTIQISVEDRLEGAIEGLVNSYGDPYTLYLPPIDSAAFNEGISGNFSGVGMEVGIRDRLVTVISPLKGTPAQLSGILSGDVIIKIDDISTEDMRIDEAVKLIRGEKGTVVNLQIFRAGEQEFIDIPITRDTIDVPTVKTEQIDDIFIIALYSFNAVAESQMQDALQEYLNSGAMSLVIDVRGNPGGYLQSAVSISSYFLPAGKIIVKEQFGDSSKDDVFRSRGRQIQTFTPESLVVLVDQGSASAAEILAGALQDHEVATVIGQQTYGKGSVQELVELENGSSLKVTIARWLTPNGTSISEGGLTPDIVISLSQANRIAEEDPQKDAAVRFLSGDEVESETFEAEVTQENQETGE
jgi:carboxyl-terminal processing protease